MSSLEQNKEAPILPLGRTRLFSDLLKVKDLNPEDKVLKPGNATGSGVRGLPPTVIVVAGFDPLRDEGLLYGKLLVENGYVYLFFTRLCLPWLISTTEYRHVLRC